MNRPPFARPHRSWPPGLRPFWVRALRPLRRLEAWRRHRLCRVEVQGLENLRAALASGAGILISPNHAAHADPFALYSAADRLGRPLHFMALWHSFARTGPVTAWLLRAHGCFSVDREGTDLKAFRHAVEILEAGRHPLVIFPEGEIYHLNDRVTPFRDGAAAAALAAARRGKRPVACLPCAIKYRYLEDPAPALAAAMDRLETRVLGRSFTGLPLAERVVKLGEKVLAVKEKEHLGEAQAGPLPRRIARLAGAILERLETGRGLAPADLEVPERVKRLWQLALVELEETPEAPRRAALEDELERVHLATQLFSYPGDYVAERPTPERLAETVEKLEEDLLGRSGRGAYARRRALVRFGEPLVVAAAGRGRGEVAELTRRLERSVQALLDGSRLATPGHVRQNAGPGPVASGKPGAGGFATPTSPVRGEAALGA